jgi:hypothetical protein
MTKTQQPAPGHGCVRLIIIAVGSSARSRKGSALMMANVMYAAR